MGRKKKHQPANDKSPERQAQLFPKFVAIKFEDGSHSDVINTKLTLKNSTLQFKSGGLVQAKYGEKWYNGEVFASGGK